MADQIGEILPSMEAEFQEGFRKCIAENKHRRELYYILVTGDWYADYTEFRLTFSPRETAPPPMLNTMLWSVDNKSGKITEIWVLKKDAPIWDPRIPLGPVDPEMMKLAPKMPLLYG